MPQAKRRRNATLGNPQILKEMPIDSVVDEEDDEFFDASEGQEEEFFDAESKLSVQKAVDDLYAAYKAQYDDVAKKIAQLEKKLELIVKDPGKLRKTQDEAMDRVEKILIRIDELKKKMPTIDQMYKEVMISYVREGFEVGDNKEEILELLQKKISGMSLEDLGGNNALDEKLVKLRIEAMKSGASSLSLDIYNLINNAEKLLETLPTEYEKGSLNSADILKSIITNPRLVSKGGASLLGILRYFGDLSANGPDSQIMTTLAMDSNISKILLIKHNALSELIDGHSDFIIDMLKDSLSSSVKKEQVVEYAVDVVEFQGEEVPRRDYTNFIVNAALTHKENLVDLLRLLDKDLRHILQNEELSAALKEKTGFSGEDILKLLPGALKLVTSIVQEKHKDTLNSVVGAALRISISSDEEKRRDLYPTIIKSLLSLCDDKVLGGLDSAIKDGLEISIIQRQLEKVGISGVDISKLLPGILDFVKSAIKEEHRDALGSVVGTAFDVTGSTEGTIFDDGFVERMQHFYEAEEKIPVVLLEFFDPEMIDKLITVAVEAFNISLIKDKLPLYEEDKEQFAQRLLGIKQALINARGALKKLDTEDWKKIMAMEVPINKEGWQALIEDGIGLLRKTNLIKGLELEIGGILALVAPEVPSSLHQMVGNLLKNFNEAISIEQEVRAFAVNFSKMMTDKKFDYKNAAEILKSKIVRDMLKETQKSIGADDGFMEWIRELCAKNPVLCRFNVQGNDVIQLLQSPDLLNVAVAYLEGSKLDLVKFAIKNSEVVGVLLKALWEVIKDAVLPDFVKRIFIGGEVNTGFHNIQNGSDNVDLAGVLTFEDPGYFMRRFSSARNYSGLHIKSLDFDKFNMDTFDFKNVYFYGEKNTVSMAYSRFTGCNFTGARTSAKTIDLTNVTIDSETLQTMKTLLKGKTLKVEGLNVVIPEEKSPGDLEKLKLDIENMLGMPVVWRNVEHEKPGLFVAGNNIALDLARGSGQNTREV